MTIQCDHCGFNFDEPTMEEDLYGTNCPRCNSSNPRFLGNKEWMLLLESRIDMIEQKLKIEQN